jgi:hypothetical protein
VKIKAGKCQVLLEEEEDWEEDWEEEEWEEEVEEEEW